MKKVISLLLVISILFTFTACSNNKAAFKASKQAYIKINEALSTTDDFASDIYKMWEIYVNKGEKFANEGISFLISSQDFHLSEDELREGIAYTHSVYLYAWNGAGYFTIEDWKALPAETVQKSKELSDPRIKDMAEQENGKYFMEFCLYSVINAYHISGKTELAQQALNEAKTMMKELSEEYSDYEHYPNLKGYYATTSALFDFCQNPSGSFEQYVDTQNEYSKEIRDYKNDLDYIFED